MYVELNDIEIRRLNRIITQIVDWVSRRLRDVPLVSGLAYHLTDEESNELYKLVPF